MRIRVPGRFIAVLAILTAFLCLLPASTKVAVAVPIGWVDVGPPNPPPTGDNDGVVLKSTSANPAAGLRAGTVVSVRSLATMRMILAVTKLDYWLFWLR